MDERPGWQILRFDDHNPTGLRRQPLQIPAVANVALEDLKALGAVLPPNVRVNVSEIADVVSAIANVIEHGSGLADTAKQGAQAVHDYFYDLAVKQAEAKGAEPPVKGNAFQAPPTAAAGAPTVTPTAGVTVDQFNALQNQIGQLAQVVQALATRDTAAAAEPTDNATEPSEAEATASTDTPAPPAVTPEEPAAPTAADADGDVI